MRRKNSQYHRVLLKLSGEFFQSTSYGIDVKIFDMFAHQIMSILEENVEIGIVIGGGNFFRGKTLAASGIGLITADHMGMLATVINGLALRDALEKLNVATRLMSPIPMFGITELFDRRKAIQHMCQKRVVIFAGGTGNPLFTTDTAATLRAVEVNADVLLKATKVDGVYSTDPKINPNAEFFPVISYDDVISKKLGVMDLSAILLCKDHHIPIHVFNVNQKDGLCKVIAGAQIGTKIVERVEV